MSIATIAAFAVAIKSNWADLSSLWTQCSSPANSSAALGHLPTPLCFAVTFFQAALASTRSRLEEAVIIAFLAGLATVTAVESEKLLEHSRNTFPCRCSSETTEHESGSKLTREMDRQGRPTGSQPRSNDLSAKVIANLTLPWILYSLALGALGWQGIIIPAFIKQSRTRQQRKTTSKPESHSPLGVEAASTASLPLSIILGLLLPSTFLLAFPSSPSIILLWLVFPLWVSLTQRLLRSAIPPHHLPKSLIYAAPVLVSALSHLLLVLHLLVGSVDDRGPLTRSAGLLLEIDHAAIFAAFLYWVFVSRGGLRAVVATVISSLVLGPGAGVCLAWWWVYRDGQQGEATENLRAVIRRAGSRRKGNFFGGPDA